MLVSITIQVEYIKFSVYEYTEYWEPSFICVECIFPESQIIKRKTIPILWLLLFITHFSSQRRSEINTLFYLIYGFQSM